MSGDGSGQNRSGGRHGGSSTHSDRGGSYGGSGGGYNGGGGGGAGFSSRDGSSRSSQSRGSGGYDGDRGRSGDDRGGSNRNSANGRDGDWRCSDPSCGNMNFARRSECNKCGTRAPSTDSRGGKTGGSYDRGEKNGGYSDNKSSKYDSGNGGSGGAYNKTPPVLPPTYGGSSLPPPSYGGDPPAESPVQCDENCGDTCDNSRIYISNLPLDVTIDELKDLFGGIGQVARIKQKRGFKDQWPWNIKIYTDDNGKNKGDGVVVYEDPAAAHSAGSFYNDHDLRGHKIKVAMAAKSAPRAPPVHTQRGGGRGGYGGGGGGGGGGPDRNFHGGNRSRPY